MSSLAGRECDFLCIGAGLGGLAGAVRAHALGLDTVIVEKDALVGGVASYSGGAVWIPTNHLQATAGVSDRRADAAEYLAFVAGDGAVADPDLELRDAFLNGAPEALRFFESSGIPWYLTGLQDQYHPQAPGSLPRGRVVETHVDGRALGPWEPLIRRSPFYTTGLTIAEMYGTGNPATAELMLADLLAERVAEGYLTRGQGLTGAFARVALAESGIPAYLETPAVDLITEGGRVAGAVVEHEGRREAVRARRGVLIACGGYGYAPWAAAMENLPSVREQGPPVIEGDAITLTDGTEAALVRAGDMFFVLGYESKTLTHVGSDAPLYRPLHDAVALPHSLVVNASGERFGDESFYGIFANAVRAFDPHHKRFTNYPSFFVADDTFRQRYPIRGLDDWPADDFTRAETLDELAQALGIDAGGLTKTVRRYNGHCADGADPDFGRGTLAIAHQAGDPAYPNPNMGPLTTPPFWGVRLEPVGAGIYSHGLAIDGGARVRRRDGSPVPGLYATGNSVAYTELVHGYENGFANGRNLAYAYLAATSAAADG